MKSLDTILAEKYSALGPKAKDAYKTKTAGERMSQESLISLCESLLDEFPSQRSGIRRNNGASREVTAQEQAHDDFLEAEQSFFQALESCRPSTSKGLSDLRECDGQYVRRDPAAEQLTESQRAEYAFCRQIGLSEGDSLKSAKTSL